MYRKRLAELLPQLQKFLLVGGIGFFVDVGVLYALTARGLDPYSARAVSFLCAATFTWIGNRLFTFRSPRPRNSSKSSEWVRYVAAMALGSAVNYGVYALLISFSETFREMPWLAVAAGTLSALGLNFLTARHLLFNKQTNTPVRS